MVWWNELIGGSSILHAILVLSCVIACGLLLGRLKVGGISVGIACVLFAGIVFGHLGFCIDTPMLYFARELGLVLFVFAIGLQVGPGFFEALRRGGLRLNLLAIAVVLLGVGCTVAVHLITGIKASTMIGIMSGAVTNTPGLGAAQQAYLAMHRVSDLSIASGYAIAYPLGVLGGICSLVLVRILCRVDLAQEEQHLAELSVTRQRTTERFTVRVTNPEVTGKTLKELSKNIPHKFVASHLRHSNDAGVELVDAHTRIHHNDVLMIVAAPKHKAFLETFFGPCVVLPRIKWEGPDAIYETRRVLVSRPSLNGVVLHSLGLRKNHGISVTRVHRAGMDLLATPDLRLQLGDRLTIVGPTQAMQRIEALMGNSEKHLDHPNLFVVFLGIVAGLLLGSVPISLPGVPHPIRLGLAGGPLIVALILGRFGHRLRLVTFSTLSANLMLREVGIALFLAGVGLEAGKTFVATLVGGGYMWVLWGIAITLVPLLLIGWMARRWLRLNYFVLIGMLAGATTDAPALAFAQSQSSSDASTVAYTSVFPLTMFLRVLVAQMLVVLLT